MRVVLALLLVACVLSAGCIVNSPMGYWECTYDGFHSNCVYLGHLIQKKAE